MNGGFDHQGQYPATRTIVRPMRRRMPAVSVIIGLNTLVFLSWQAAAAAPGLRQFMVANFLVSTTRLQDGHLWTLITAAFSQAELWHFAVNMFVLWSFGTVLERFWGTRIFVAFYLIAAVVSSISHCAVSSILMGSNDILALGASGAISGLLLAYAFFFPRHKILLFAIIPIPALAGVLAFVGLDVWGLVAQTKGGGLPIGHGAHLGGALAGAVMYFAYLRARFPISSAPASRPLTVASQLSRDEAVEFERLRLKIDREGPQSLTPKEQDFLDRLRERVMRAHQEHLS
ncbi:MAG: rhomboid family intramembrane serine protease [Thermoanaerobaculales bacterium]